VILDKPKRVNIDRKNAITKYRVLDSNGDASLIECQPETGIKHQIRVHLSFGLNCPILGDHKYSHHIKLAPQVYLIIMNQSL
jgi:mitochondrial RNA pseudouridine synthase RPUSD4